MEKLAKKEKKGRAKAVFKYLFLAMLILEMLVLSVEALLPGEASSASSGAFGEAVDDIMTDLSDDEIRDVRPESISVKRNGKAISSLSMKSGTHTTLALAFSPASVSVNYREAVWTSEDKKIAEIADGKLYARGIGETVIKVSLAEFPEIKAELPVKVTEVIAEKLHLSFGDGSKDTALEVGDKALLITSTEPRTTDGSIKYESMDETVAVVKGKSVEAVGTGETTVKATYTPATEPEKALTEEVTVRVSERTHPLIPIENLTVDPGDTPAIRYDGAVAYLYPGDTGNFTAKLVPEDTTENTVLWESSDNSVLSVNAAGEFVSRAKGKVTLTAVSVSNSALRAQCTIEVRNRTLGVKLELNGAKLTPADTAGTYTLTLNAGSRNASLSLTCEDEKQLYYKYETSDGSVARLYRDGTIAALRPSSDGDGTVTLTVTVADNKEFSNENGGLAQTYTILLTVKKQVFSESVDGWGTFVRKLFGHFGAFLAVGATAAIVAIFYDNGSWKRRLILLAALIVLGFTFACFTELLQTELFTTGRAASFSDVIIDCNGYMPAALIVYGCFLAVSLVIFIVKKLRARKKKEESPPQS